MPRPTDWILVRKVAKGQANIDPIRDWKTCRAVTILEPVYQSQPSPTIHYTCNESRLEGMWCYELQESIQTYFILVWKVGYWSQNCYHPQLISQGVVMVIHVDFKSQPFTIIHYTCNKTLERLICCGLPKSVQTHSILVRQMDNRRAKPTLLPPVTEKHAVVTILEPMYQSQPSQTIHYICNERLEGMRCNIILESIMVHVTCIFLC